MTDQGRTTYVYASGYDRTRVHDGQLVRGESRSLVVDFNGLLDVARTVTSVTWRCSDPGVLVMSNASIAAGARSVAVEVLANWPCDSAIKCEATLDNGETRMQRVRLAVAYSPCFDNETTATSGPSTLTSP